MLNWLEQSPVADWVAASAWGYPVTLSSHGVGMAVVVGVIVMICLRMLGVFPGIPLEGLRRLVPLMWAGFILNLVSGIGLFTADAERFFWGSTFQIKIALIVIGLIIFVVMDRTAIQPVIRSGGTLAVPVHGKVLAVVSILFWWLAVILSGRLIAYLM